MVALFVRGFGLGAVTMPLMAVAFLGLEHEEVPDASIITRIAQQVGGSFGTAVLAVILAGRDRGDGSRDLADAFHIASGGRPASPPSPCCSRSAPGRPPARPDPTPVIAGAAAAPAGQA